MALPVIVGIGQATNRGDDLVEPLTLLGDAAAAALQDAGPGAASATELASVDVVAVVSWHYEDLPSMIAGRMGLTTASATTTPVGGDQPTRALVAAGHRAMVSGGLHLVVGGETVRSVGRAMASGDLSAFTPMPEGAAFIDPRDLVAADAQRHGMLMPPSVYPLYENALRARLGQSLEDSQQWSARLWAVMSEVAAETPGAWFPEPRSVEDVATPGPSNRMVFHPYTKLMNALIAVDQAAAVVVTDDETARSLGVADDRMIHLWNGAGAADTSDFLQRVAYDRAPAMAASLEDALAAAGLGRDRDELSLVELYSCFPCVPKLAIDHLGWPTDAPTSVTGGLTFFGGPGNAYMLCAAVAMVRRLRELDDERPALLYGNGEFVTKHHSLLLGRAPRPGGPLPSDEEPARQAAVDALAAPPYEPEPSGAATIETYTVEYDRDGEPAKGIVIGRLDGSGARFVANDTDADDLEVLTAGKVEPVGLPGEVTAGDGDAPNRFRLR